MIECYSGEAIETPSHIISGLAIQDKHLYQCSSGRSSVNKIVFLRESSGFSSKWACLVTRFYPACKCKVTAE